jgi:hypothetical protein
MGEMAADRPAEGVLAAAAAGGGVPGLLGLLLAMEAGVPVPVPSDLVMLLLGERVSAGALPLWLAAAALEVVALAGTAALFLVARGPGRALLARVGPRLGLTGQRLALATGVLERRGRAATPWARRPGSCWSGPGCRSSGSPPPSSWGWRRCSSCAGVVAAAPPCSPRGRARPAWPWGCGQPLRPAPATG